MRGELLATDDPSWIEALSATRHDVYHLPGLVEFASRWQVAGTPFLFMAQEAGDRFLVPLIVRPIPTAIAGEPGWFDATGPRGYPGPIVGAAAEVADGFTDRAIACLVEALRERRIASAFIRCHPLLTPPLEPFRRAGRVVEHGHAVSIDLSSTPEELWAQTRASHRRGINKAIRRGYRVRIDEDWGRFDEFVAIFEATMDRLEAASHWRLPAGYFMDLRAALGDALKLCVVELGDELAAAALITEVDGLAEYHLSGTSPAHVAASPSKLIIDFARRWARERGDRVLNLAGSLAPDDPLIYFKLGFSPLRHPVVSWRLVADPEAYAELSARQERLAPTAGPAPGGATAADEYFPAYRRPASRPADE